MNLISVLDYKRSKIFKNKSKGKLLKKIRKREEARIK